MSSTDLLDRLDTLKTHLLAYDGWTRRDVETIDLAKQAIDNCLPRKWYRIKGTVWKN